jgi:hypothetical protein
MLPDEVEVRLREIGSSFFERSDVPNSKFTLEEKEPEGKAKVYLYLSNDSIFFNQADNMRFNWIKEQKCADHIVFEHCGESYILHIFELKTTIKIQEWLHIQKQFKGACLRALAIAGFLNIKISDVIVYSCYREERISGIQKPIVYRTANIDKNTRNAMSSWNEDSLRLDIFNGIVCKNKKIELDAESRTAEYHI